MLFAQIESVPSDAIKNFILIAAGALACAYYIKEIFFKGDAAPQPFEVVKAKDYVQKQEFKDHVDFNNTTHKDLFAKIGGVERGARSHIDQKLDEMTRSAEAGREKLHDRINDVLKAVSELRGTVQEMQR